jgi:hypothetical protein
MNILDPLSTIAEFSIGLAGFTGIIAVVANFNDSELEIVKFRISNLLVTAFAPGFFSLITICMVFIGLAEDIAIRSSSALLVIYLLCWTVWVIGNTPDNINSTFRRAMWTSAMLNLLLQLAIITTLLANPIGFYLLGLVILLLQGAAVFSALAMATFRVNQ